MKSPEDEAGRAGVSSAEGICAPIERALGQVETLLDAGSLAEAVQVLEANEARLLALRGTDAHAGAVVVDRTRVAELLRRTGQLLSGCEAMRDQVAVELRALRTQGRFLQGDVPPRHGSWFSERA